MPTTAAARKATDDQQLQDFENLNCRKQIAERYLQCLSGQTDISKQRFCFQTFAFSKNTKEVDPTTARSISPPENRHGTLDECWDWLLRANQHQHAEAGGFSGVYCCVNETEGCTPGRPGGRKARQVVRIRAIFAELDDGRFESESINRFAEKFGCSMIVESSPGKIHAYWCLTEEASTAFQLEKFSRVQLLLAERFSGFSAGRESKDLPRVLRLPGFYHFKTLDSVNLVTLAVCNPELRYSLEEVLDLVGIDAEFVKAFDLKSRSGSASTGIPGELPRIHPDIAAAVADGGEYQGAGSGSRNEALWHYLFQYALRLRGLSKLETLAVGLLANQKNSPPLAEAEVEAIVDSCWKRFVESGAHAAPMPGLGELVFDEYDAKKEEEDGELAFEYDYSTAGMTCAIADSSLADRIIQKIGNLIKYNKNTGFYFYNRHIWLSRDDSGKAALHSAMESIFRGVLSEPQVQGMFTTAKGDLNLSTWRTFCRDLYSTSRFAAICGKLSVRPEIMVTPDYFNADSDVEYLAVKNGILDLRSGGLIPPNPGIKLTRFTATEFHPESSCPTWEYFIDSCMAGDSQLVSYIQKITGYLLSGKNDLQSLFICFGKSGTGKSLYVSVLQALLGEYCSELDPSLLLNGKGSENAKLSSLAQAIHCRLGCIQETSSKDSWNENFVKAVTGGDKLYAKFSHKDVCSFDVRFKILIRANALPTADQVDEALWTRMKFMPFEVRFRGTEAEDKSLLSKLKLELPGILNWAVKGYQMLLADGLQEPPQALRQKEKNQELSEPIRVFVTKYCVKCPYEEGINYPTFERAFKNFCLEEGIEPGKKVLNRNLLFTELGFLESVCWDKNLKKSVKVINLKLTADGQALYSNSPAVINFRI